MMPQTIPLEVGPFRNDDNGGKCETVDASSRHWPVAAPAAWLHWLLQSIVAVSRRWLLFDGSLTAAAGPSCIVIFTGLEYGSL